MHLLHHPPNHQSSFLVLLLMTLCAFIKQGLAIKCYMCNSAPTRNARTCAELPGDSTLFEQDCDILPEARANRTKYSVCRKMHQKIFDTDGNSEERIIRQCGTETPVGCTWRTRPNTLHVETCHCKTDLCNAAIGRIHYGTGFRKILFASALSSWFWGRFVLQTVGLF